MEKYFKELNVAHWFGKTIIVDIDGTLTTDGGSDFDPSVSQKIQEMATSNFVFLFSNKKLLDRDKELAEKLHISLIETSFKKPNRKVIDHLPEFLKQNIIVVGDKVLIDGFFAKNIKADFIKVKRLTSEKDSLSVKFIYMIDNFTKYFIN